MIIGPPPKFHGTRDILRDLTNAWTGRRRSAARRADPRPARGRTRGRPSTTTAPAATSTDTACTSHRLRSRRLTNRALPVTTPAQIDMKVGLLSSRFLEADAGRTPCSRSGPPRFCVERTHKLAVERNENPLAVQSKSPAGLSKEGVRNLDLAGCLKLIRLGPIGERLRNWCLCRYVRCIEALGLPHPFEEVVHHRDVVIPVNQVLDCVPLSPDLSSSGR